MSGFLSGRIRAGKDWVVWGLVAVVLGWSGAGLAEASEAPEAPEAPEVSEAPAASEVPGHLRFFGYYHADGYPQGVPDHLDEIGLLGNSNVAMIGPQSDRAQFQAMLQRCADYGLEAWVGVYDCFFEWKPGKVGDSALVEDWRARWDRFKEQLRGAEDQVLGFAFDEPFWNGVREEDFRFITKMIREEFPEKRLFACLTILELDAEALSRAVGRPMPEVSETYYEFVTDGAFDAYAKWDTWCDYPGKLERLKTKLVGGQQLWLIPWAFTNETEDSSPAVLEENLRKMFEMACREPRCAGLLPFSFASGDAGDWGSGCHRLFNPLHRLYAPDLRAAHLRIGKAIVHRPKPSDIPLRVDFETEDPPGCSLTGFARITGDPGQVLAGARSLLADTRTCDSEWNVFLETPPGLLESGARYALSFDYRVIERDPEVGWFYFLFESAKEKEARGTPWVWKSYTAWKGAGEKGAFHLNAVLGPYDDYAFRMAVHGKGAIVIDNLRLRKRPALQTQSRAVESEEPWEPFGICLQAGHTWVYTSEEDIRRAIRLIAEAGVQWIRTGVGWPSLEPEQDQINEAALQRQDAILEEAADCGLKCYMQLLATPKWASTGPDQERFWAYAPKDLERWRRYVRYMAERYAARIEFWEVWNEMDWEFWESPLEDFVPLLKVAHEEIKRANPECRVVLGGLSTDGLHSWDNPRALENALQRLYDAGAGPYFDILSIHPYAEDVDIGFRQSIEKINTAYGVMRRNGDGHKRIWITELGMSTNGHSLEEQRAYLQQVFSILPLHPMVDKLFWYNFRCIGEDPADREHNFGIVNHDFSPRPAYEALKQMKKTGPRRVADGLLEMSAEQTTYE